MTERFESDWLSLRERADAAARSRELTGHARRWLARRRPPYRIVDLGAGGGNNAAWLSARLPGPQRWRLVDHDAALLDRAISRLVPPGSGTDTGFEAHCIDLAELDAALPDGTDLAVASALFDLASPGWVDALALRCATIGCAALWTLTVDGDWRFIDADGAGCDTASDGAMRARLRAHQRRDKGMGSALGGEAPARLAAAFEARGYRVQRVASPWRLRSDDDPALALELMSGWRRALLEQSPDAGEEIEGWWSRRRDAVARGELGIEVGHADLWVEPQE